MSDLARFHEAQATAFPLALIELTAGRKTSHWMWFIFPQLRDLGRSATAQHFGIEGITEARAYLDDPILHQRLEAAADALLLHVGERPETIIGTVDALKLRSSATLFALAGEGSDTGAKMQAILDAFYRGEPCPLTLRLLEKAGDA
ncbi:MAG: DUF1810 family protein [Rhodobacteraceae bacterium]|nr:DUF1810 family protein [Paracoccaceae bacterium]